MMFVKSIQDMKKLSMRTSQFSSSFLLFLLLSVSGNPEGRQSKYIALVLLIIISIFYYKFYSHEFVKKISSVFFLLFLLFFIQQYILGFTSWLGNINLLVKILLAGLIFTINKGDFTFNYFNVMFYISLLSLFLMGLDLFGVIDLLPYTYSEDDRFYYFFYQTRPDFLRNSGMFWEPGVFSNYLILSIALILPQLKRINKFRLFVIIATIISTFSTSGFLILFIIFFYKMIKLNLFNILSTLVLSFIFYNIYISSPFLNEKITEQNDIALSAEGEMNYTRLGQLLFDLHYIEKHPLIGNGMHVKTRYSDHPIFQDETYEVGHGNGFSQFIVSFGILFVIFYFVSIARNVRFFQNNKFGYSLFFVLIIILSLQNEPMMTYPFYWGFLFLNDRFDV